MLFIYFFDLIKKYIVNGWDIDKEREVVRLENGANKQ